MKNAFVGSVNAEREMLLDNERATKKLLTQIIANTGFGSLPKGNDGPIEIIFLPNMSSDFQEFKRKALLENERPV